MDFTAGANDFEALFALHNGTSDVNGDEFAALTHALTMQPPPQVNQDDFWIGLEPSAHEVSNNSTTVSSPMTPGTPGTPITRPKLGSRFSRDVIRTLKNWLAIHHQHPYPNEDQMAALQSRTGLNKAQLTNWFANARRRGKVQAARPASPQVHPNPSGPIDIIQRPGTPAIRQRTDYKDPLQRWVDSPPEHEPASVRDIARAMEANSGESSRHVRGSSDTYNNPWQSPYARSSASSAGTSQSSGEYSARHSSGSQSSFKMRRVPRRKRANRRQRIEKKPVIDPLMSYQCTFCTEVFKTKYDWQRHEKSLHLPLEKWICGLHGAKAAKKEVAGPCCVYCGEMDPSEQHIEAHHHSACQERCLEERTFHRKDHLVQHLRLVHGAKFLGWSMAQWMVPMPNIPSRCGFCGFKMTTWLERTDHLGDHFKSGVTMASWQGDWGFDDATLDKVENAIPPYFVDYERSTLIPMKASDPPWGSPPNAYELLKVEIEYFVQCYFDRVGHLPSNDAMQLEACRIIYAAEGYASIHLNVTDTSHSRSWLRDLVMSSPELSKQARFGPIRTSSESRHSPLKINGQDYIFEQCPLEAQLRVFVTTQQLLGVPIDDSQLHNEACTVVKRMEMESDSPSDIFVNWMVKGIYSSSDWLADFKIRAGIGHIAGTTTMNLPAQTDPIADFQWDHTRLSTFFEPTMDTTSTIALNVGNTMIQSTDVSAPSPPSQQPSTSNTHGRLRTLLPDDTNFYRVFDNDMKRWAAATMSPNNPNCHVPSDEEIQHQARWIMYDGDDPWNQTPADYEAWLVQFKRLVGITHNAEVVNPVDLATNIV